MNYYLICLCHRSHGALRSLSNVKYTKIFNFCEGPLLTGHVHPSLFGSQGLNEYFLLALALQSPMIDPESSFCYL